MRFTALTIFACVFAVCSTAKSQDAASPEAVRYLGLAVPYPEHLSDEPIMVPADESIASGKVRIWAKIDSAGNVIDISSTDSTNSLITPVRGDLEALRFQFTPGESLPQPLSVPVDILYSGSQADGWSARISFPVSPEFTTDSILLKEFFSANGIEPPRIMSLNPIDYQINDRTDSLRYWTITAQVSLDSGGNLQDISYPIAGQAEMRHQVHMALMHARYSPAQLHGRPIAAEFLVTFRIFDNINYPFSPCQQMDSAKAPISSRYFMTYYYSEKDISLPPLPRNHADGFIIARKLGEGKHGTSDVTVDIDQDGKVTRAVMTRTRAGLQGAATQLARLFRWYPAIDAQGQPMEFTGEISFQFDGTSKIVYIPEWLSR
jgi:hypothetical protein